MKQVYLFIIAFAICCNFSEIWGQKSAEKIVKASQAYFQADTSRSFSGKIVTTPNKHRFVTFSLNLNHGELIKGKLYLTFEYIPLHYSKRYNFKD